MVSLDKKGWGFKGQIHERKQRLIKLQQSCGVGGHIPIKLKLKTKRLTFAKVIREFLEIVFLLFLTKLILKNWSIRVYTVQVDEHDIV